MKGIIGKQFLLPNISSLWVPFRIIHRIDSISTHEDRF